MVSDDHCHVGIGFDPFQDALANLRMALHLFPFLQRQWAIFQEETCRKADLADVVNKAAKVGTILLVERESHSLGDIA